MNISVFCPRYLWAGGGSVLFARRLSEELARRGHAVTLVTDEPPANPRHPESAPAGCALRALPRDPAAERRAQARVDWEKRRGCYRLARWLLSSGKQRLIAAGPWCPDMTEARNFADADAFIAINTGSTALGENLRHALAWRHGQIRLSIPLFHPREEFAGLPHHDVTHLQFDAVATLSAHERDFLTRRGWPAELIRVVGAGSDALPSPGFSFRGRFRVPEGAPLVLFLGRKIHNKGVTHVLAAMDEVWDRHPDARLALVGFSHNPPEWMEGHLDRSRHPARERTIRLDDVDEETREAALAACDVLAAPSISDSFGIVYLDAWRHGKPVIACRDTCCDSIVRDGVNGRLVPFGDVPAIASALLGLLADPLGAREMGEAGRALQAARHRWSDVADRVEELFDLVRETKRLPAPAGAPARLAVGMVWDDMTRLGGVNTWILQCVHHLRRRGIDVWLLDLAEEESGQVDITPERHRVVHLARGARERSRAHRRRIRREIESRGIGFLLFHEHRFGEDVLEALPAGFPAANVLHVDRPDERYYGLAAALDPWLAAQFCVSPRIRDNLLPRLPAGRRDRVLHLPLGVAIPPAPPPRATGRGPVRLVYAGRIAREQKRVQDIAPFLDALDAAGTAWELDVLGDGPDLTALRGELAPRVLGGRVRLHGAVPAEAVQDALLRAHVLLLFSDFEGLPLVLLEAMARRVVPVVPRLPSGIGDILEDGRDALLFPAGQPAAAAEAVRTLAADPARHARLAEAARATAEGFDLERCLDAYAERMKALAAAAPGLSGKPSRHEAGQRLADPAGGAA